MINISFFSNEELWTIYAKIQQELKNRSLIRTGNMVIEHGESLVIETYKSIKGLPKLHMAPEGIQNVDLLSENGDRYSIKTIIEPNNAIELLCGIGSINNKDFSEKTLNIL